MALETAFRNGSLQGAYLILALRAQGLHCGPMSGFDPAKVDAAFFPEGRHRSNFLLNIGYGERAGFRPRLPRLGFAEAARWDQKAAAAPVPAPRGVREAAARSLADAQRSRQGAEIARTVPRR